MKATRPRYGRRTNLEARRLLGVEAQDAGLRCRAPPAARSPRRSFALLERAAARPSRRRGPLRRVGLVAGHPSMRALLLATSYAIGASTGQLCVQHKANESRRPGQVAAAPARYQSRLEASSASPLAGLPTPWMSKDPASPRLSDLGCSSGEATLVATASHFTQRQHTRTGVATRPIGLCSAPSKPAAREVDKQ